ncbi:hypothetical protein V6N11_068106 [Hibiscus sabdariffa]|uniref:Uncharacterized protein n=1 Tax=Hibiscus sabdariffa TaxID=183260 RepID=A0ABR2STM1_9ROSI
MNWTEKINGHNDLRNLQSDNNFNHKLNPAQATGLEFWVLLTGLGQKSRFKVGRLGSGRGWFRLDWGRRCHGGRKSCSMERVASAKALPASNGRRTTRVMFASTPGVQIWCSCLEWTTGLAEIKRRRFGFQQSFQLDFTANGKELERVVAGV